MRTTKTVTYGMNIPGSYNRDTISGVVSTARTLRSLGKSVSIIIKGGDANSVSFVREMCPDCNIDQR